MKTISVVLAAASVSLLVVPSSALAHGPRSASHKHDKSEDRTADAADDDRVCEILRYGPSHHPARNRRHVVCRTKVQELASGNERETTAHQ